jgi:hypothetical protein
MGAPEGRSNSTAAPLTSRASAEFAAQHQHCLKVKKPPGMNAQRLLLISFDQLLST